MRVAGEEERIRGSRVISEIEDKKHTLRGQKLITLRENPAIPSVYTKRAGVCGIHKKPSIIHHKRGKNAKTLQEGRPIH